MSILEKLGLAPKKQRKVPVIGEKKKQQEQSSSLQNNIYIRSLIILGFLGVLIASIPQTSFKEPINYSIGEPWRADNLTAPFTFPIKKDQETIAMERENIRDATLPIYNIDPQANVQIQNRLDSLYKSLEPVLNSYEQWQIAKEDTATDSRSDSLQFVNMKKNAPLDFSEDTWKALITHYEQTVIQNKTAASSFNVRNEFVLNVLKQQITDITTQLLEEGIIDTSKSALEKNKVIVRDLKERTERTRNVANLYDIKESIVFTQQTLSETFSEDIVSAGTRIFEQVIQPNILFDPVETQSHIQEALSEVSTTQGAVAQGQVIIRKGDIVTEEKLTMLESLAEARSQNATTMERWLRYGGDIIAVIAIVTIFFFYLYLYRRYIFKNNALLLLVLIAMSIICIGSSIVYELDTISSYIVPVAIAPIILTIIFDSRVGLLATITLALLTGLIDGNNFEHVTATTVACSLGLFSVRDIKKRSQFFFTTPGIVFLSYTIVVIAFSMTAFQGWTALANELFFIAINAIFILFTYPLILLFEKTFNVTTDFTLLELSDTNLPLLKDLMTKAPGSFHHSLQVSNLAEAAAGAIGANSLLCRVGGLYHDIGKMENPGYFTENQTESNEHDKLKPRMSALVIKAHVSNGVKIAEEHKLPEIIIDFIKTHHGTSLIKFFWDKAQENADEDKKEIREEDFRYDGPLPQTKETGILLLADCIEASSRAMKDPNYQKLENLIDKMIETRVSEGQLSKTPLTFKDLTTIKETFLNILVGIYHSRVEYPDEEKESESTDQSSEDKKPERSKISESKQAEEQEEGDSTPPVDEYYNS
ncbi:HDIG domain-containing protein [Aliifodinibius salicampi]|uniref:HDIG domain-containing protein n=1 Tax=Fodinibius salicampi TaxID=1920655 RepID=A0ABT3Q037_9BACT|nr:HDIG domain-containing metalloprotein [Fodinibius salicampi]MCW9713442.1 HDIG domain-containing protein [Fodinibius salicampi]